MAEEIYRGHDCTKEAKVSTRTDKKTGKVTEYYRALKLERNRISAKPGETVMLKLLHSHADCDDVCYLWKHVAGLGYLIENQGPEVGFALPMENLECEMGAIVKVYCANKRLDTAFINTPHKDEDPRAYMIVGTTVLTHITLAYQQPGIAALGISEIDTATAYYLYHSFDCLGSWIESVPGVYLSALSKVPPKDKFLELYGHLAGKTYDFRTSSMIHFKCCGPKPIHPAFEKILSE